MSYIVPYYFCAVNPYGVVTSTDLYTESGFETFEEAQAFYNLVETAIFDKKPIHDVGIYDKAVPIDVLPICQEPKEGIDF